MGRRTKLSFKKKKLNQHNMSGNLKYQSSYRPKQQNNNNQHRNEFIKSRNPRLFIQV